MLLKVARSIFISYLLLIAASSSVWAASPEENYLKMRDGFIAQQTENKEAANFSVLEDNLKKLVGSVHVDGCSEQGTINLLTLAKDQAGFGQVDGLRFSCGEGTLFVTTIPLLDSFLANHPELPKDLPQLAKNEEFYRLVFHVDAAVFLLAEIPVKDGSVHAFFGTGGQDIGPLVPADIYVFRVNKDRLFLLQEPAQSGGTEITECKETWEGFAQKEAEAFAAYRASGLKDIEAINDSFRYREEGFTAYRGCYERMLSKQPSFKPLKKQAQEMADRLSHN